MACFQIFVMNAAFFAVNGRVRIPRIINGRDTTIEKFPYQASLRLENEHFCGASIISQKHVVTSGHCIIKDMISPYSNYRVVTGTSFRSSQGSIHRIANITVHPDFWTDLNSAINDIAVITLKDSIVFDKYQQKINLPQYDFKVGDKAKVTGWGSIHENPDIETNQLQLFETELVSNVECQKHVRKEIKIYDTEICTVVKIGYGTCDGDSGGPLEVNGELVGIVSWSDGDLCADENPDVYKYKDFIKSIVNQKN